MSTQNFPHPLRLAVGSHQAGTGQGCAMNIISYENGDQKITDYPACSDRVLARMVQQVNDSTCTHRDGELLCSNCSLQVLELGHATVGTTGHELTSEALQLVHVRIAAFAARQVLHLVREKDRAVCEAAIVAAETYADDPSDKNADAAAAARAASAAAYAADAARAAAYAADAARAAAYAATDAATDAAAYAAAYAADAATYAGLDKVALAHKIITEFKRLTGLGDVETPPETTRQAVARMLVKATP